MRLLDYGLFHQVFYQSIKASYSTFAWQKPSMNQESRIGPAYLHSLITIWAKAVSPSFVLNSLVLKSDGRSQKSCFRINSCRCLIIFLLHCNCIIMWVTQSFNSGFCSAGQFVAWKRDKDTDNDNSPLYFCRYLGFRKFETPSLSQENSFHNITWTY